MSSKKSQQTQKVDAGSLCQKKNECRYKDVCDLYNEDAIMCNDEDKAVNYYAVGRPVGCFREHMDKEKNHMWLLFFVGIAVIVICNVIGTTFSNPHPCSESGIGCENIWEMLSDSWSGAVAYFGTWIGIVLCILGINYLRDEKNEKRHK